MKCVEIEKMILLQDSGELGTDKRRVLENHLSGCEPCRRFKEMLLGAATAVQGEEPPIRVVHNILREARKNAPVKKRPVIFGLKPAVALAACIVAAFGLFAGLYTPDRVGMEFTIADAQLLDSEDQVVSIMYEGLSEDDLAFNFLMTYDG